MPAIHYHIAETRRQIDDALRVRYQVFAEELEYIELARRFVPLEIDPFDTLETTVHLVACVDGAPVGAMRIQGRGGADVRSTSA